MAPLRNTPYRQPSNANQFGGTTMKTEQIREEIRETNLAYLMLAQRLLREDRAVAMVRLGLSEETAAVLEQLSTAQVLKLAASSMLMCRFRFDDEMLWGLLTSHSKDGALPSGMHAAILMAGQPLAQAA